MVTSGFPILVYGMLYLPTLNEIVEKQAAVAAWKAVKVGALQDLLEQYDD